MDKTKRGAASQYEVLNLEAIKNLKIKELSADDALLALWVPSSMLQDGLDCMKAWGFRQTQTHIWVKVKKQPLISLLKSWGKIVKFQLKNVKSIKDFASVFSDMAINFDLHDTLAFGLGRLFRQTHEICLIGVKGKIYKHLKNKSQRSVHFAQNMKHSAKPEHLQDMLDIMFPDPNLKRCELFARRNRIGWHGAGNQLEGPTFGQDIRDSIENLINE